MTAEQILKLVRELIPLEQQGVLRLFKVKDSPNEVYFGIDAENRLLFAMPSFHPAMRHQLQQTRKLDLHTNLKCRVVVDSEQEDSVMHVLACNSESDDEKIAFIRLTEAFARQMSSDQPNIMNELFSALVSLFALEGKSTETELQGLYAELYLIYYLLERGIDIAPFWQKQDKLNFDFSISSSKRIEVKSTLRQERIHHFRHEQLLSELYDILIVSVLLRKDDMGFSLALLVEKVRTLLGTDFGTLLHLDRLIKNHSTGELQAVCYDPAYTAQHIRFFAASVVPKFEEEQPDGVTHTEYDSDLSTSDSLDIEAIRTWLNG